LRVIQSRFCALAFCSVDGKAEHAKIISNLLSFIDNSAGLKGPYDQEKYHEQVIIQVIEEEGKSERSLQCFIRDNS